MSGKIRSRASANTTDSATQSLNEKILKECHSLYIDPENGKTSFDQNFCLKTNGDGNSGIFLLL